MGVTAISTTLDGEVTSRAFEATSRSRPASLKITAVVADIFSHDCARIITDEVSKSFNSRVDIFVNNAGATGTGTIGEMSADHIQRSLFADASSSLTAVSSTSCLSDHAFRGAII